MSLADCVGAVADELGISRADAEEIAARLDGFRKRQAAAGKLDRAEEQLRAFANSEAEKARIAAALKRKQSALTILVRDAIDRHIDAQLGRGVPLPEAIVSYLVGGIHSRDSVSARRAALEGDWLKGMLAEARRDVPVVFDLLTRPPAETNRFFADVVREMHELRQDGQPGMSGNRDAQKLAQIFARHAEAARLETNRAGANIGRLDGWAGPQNWDDRAILKAGVDQFVAIVLPELDLARSFGQEGPVDLAEARTILSEVYYNIVTGRDRGVSAAQRGEHLSPRNIADSLAEHRVLHFKDADAWLRVHELLGTGNIATAMIGHLGALARKASLMQMLGPNPEVMLRSVLESRARAERLAAGSGAAAPGREVEARSIIDQLRMQTGFLGGTAIGKAYAVVSGLTDIPSNVSQARFFAGVRATMSWAKLGASLMSQFSDLASYAAAMHDQGRGLFQGHLDAWNALMVGGGEAARQRALLIGVGADSLLGDIHAHWSGETGLVGKMATANAAFYRWSGLHWWQNRFETQIANMTSSWMAEQATRGFAELDPAYSHLLTVHGLGGDRWEVVRLARELAEDGRHYVMPGAVATLPDEAFHPLVADAMAEAEDALRERIQAQSQGRRQAAVTRAADRVAKASQRLQEAESIARPANRARALEARQRALEAAQTAHELARQRLAAGEGAPPRELTEAEAAQLEQRRARLIARERRNLELDLRGFFADEAAYGVLKGDDRSKMFVTQGTQPGSPLGEAVRFMMQFQSYAVAYAQRRLGRSFRGYAGADPSQGFLRSVGAGAVANLPAIASLIAASTVYGYLSMTAKDFLKNRTPKDPTRVPTILAALVQGGGLGLYGDYLFGQYDRMGGGLASRLIGPAAGEAVNLVELMQKARAGDAKAGDAIHFALNNAPFVNLWFVRAGLDLAVLNALQEWASPGTLQRRQRTLLSQFGQRFVVNPTPLAARPSVPRSAYATSGVPSLGISRR